MGGKSNNKMNNLDISLDEIIEKDRKIKKHSLTKMTIKRNHFKNTDFKPYNRKSSSRFYNRNGPRPDVEIMELHGLRKWSHDKYNEFPLKNPTDFSIHNVYRTDAKYIFISNLGDKVSD